MHGPMKMNVTWGNVLAKQSNEFDYRPLKSSNVNYFLIYTRETRARLDTICMLMDETRRRYDLKVYEVG